MTFFQQFGADISQISLCTLYPSDGFIMVPCMSDLVESEIQRLGEQVYFLR